jgi:phosphoribosyl-ATP pyrophosphohydrolase/phosphoribosyl-AMP cyclohydrolase
MKIKLDGKGLVPAIVQDAGTGRVLMLGYMSPGSLKLTLEGSRVCFYSRSREELWLKGETSGNYLNLREAWLDCDGDTVLLKVDPDGPTCHTGETSCFFTPIEELPDEFEAAESGPGILDEVFGVIRERQRDLPESSYTAQLFREGAARIAQKVIEEAGETAISAAQGDYENLPKEVADLLYHTMVLLAATGVSPQTVWQELRQRRK